MAKPSLSIMENFVVISPEQTATTEKPDSGLYERLDRTYNGFQGHQLVSCHEFDRDWPSWEIHPHGDEIVILLSGEATFVLQHEAGNEAIELTEPGRFAIVPQNVWHTAKTRMETRVLFITPGEGTKHNAGEPNSTRG